MTTADLLIVNAQVYTVDEANPQAEAVAVRGNRIVYVGDSAGAMAWRGPHTRLVDGQGRTLLPGFIDSHFHLLHGSLGLGDISLRHVSTLAELQTAVAIYAANQPHLPWLVGRGLRYGLPSATDTLTRHHLDAIEGQRPLVFVAYDVHTAWANTVALERAGLLHSHHQPLPGSAEVVLDADGLPTGELREGAAYDPLFACVPKPSAARQRELLQMGLAQAAALGITSIHNMDGDAEQASLYAALEDMGELTLRVYIPYSVTPETPLAALAQEAVSLRETFNSEMVRGGCVKFFMDGVLESYTALVLDGYPDQPHNLGEPIFSADHFSRMAVEADRLGLQIFVHACGDGAVRRVLDGYEAAQRVNGRRDSRHRVEHIELIHPHDVNRFAELGVIASMQPLHAPLLADDPDVWRQRVRRQDWDRSFAWRTLRSAGARLAFGSDWPVVTQNPYLGLAAALNRQPWGPGHNPHTQTLGEAIASYTRGAAYAEFQEDKKGQIQVGLWADLVLLAHDIFAFPPADLAQVQVMLTVSNGRVVFEQ